MEDLNKLNQEFQELKNDVNYANYARLKQIYNIFSKHASDLFRALNDYNTKLSQTGEVTHENIITYGVYDATVDQMDQYGVWLNIHNARFQAKVDPHHLNIYESYKGTKVSKGDKRKIIIIKHKFENNRRITNAVFQKYTGHEGLFKFYDIYNKDLTLDNIKIGGFYKGFVNGIIPDKDNPTKGKVFVCLRSDISGPVRVNSIKDYDIGRIVDVKVLQKIGENLSTHKLRESRDGSFDFYI